MYNIECQISYCCILYYTFLVEIRVKSLGLGRIKAKPALFVPSKRSMRLSRHSSNLAAQLVSAKVLSLYLLIRVG